MRAVACLLFALFFVAYAEEASDAVVLTSSNFESSLQSGDWFLKFYAPWCGHCKKLAPTWDTLATRLKGKVNVGKIDCTVEKDLCSRFGIRGYPTLKFASKGQLFDYKGARSEDDLASYAEGGFQSGASVPLPAAGAAPAAPAVEKKAEVPVVEGESEVVVLTDGTLDAKLAQGGNWLLEFYAPWCGHCKKLAPTWEAVARELKGKVNVAKVDCTTETAICGSQRFGIRGYPTVKFYAQGKVYDYQGDRSQADLVRFSTGGFANAPSADLPAAPSSMDKVQLETTQALKQVEDFLKAQVWATLGGVFVVGVVVGRCLFR